MAAFPGFLPINHIPCTPQSRKLSREATDLEASARILDVMAPILGRNISTSNSNSDSLRQALTISASDMHQEAKAMDLAAREAQAELIRFLAGGRGSNWNDII